MRKRSWFLLITLLAAVALTVPASTRAQNIDCKGAQKGDTLKVRGEVSRMTKLIAFTEAVVTNADGEVITRSTGTFMVSRADA